MPRATNWLPTPTGRSTSRVRGWTATHGTRALGRPRRRSLRCRASTETASRISRDRTDTRVGPVGIEPTTRGLKDCRLGVRARSPPYECTGHAQVSATEDRPRQLRTAATGTQGGTTVPGSATRPTAPSLGPSDAHSSTSSSAKKSLSRRWLTSTVASRVCRAWRARSKELFTFYVERRSLPRRPRPASSSCASVRSSWVASTSRMNLAITS